MIGSSAEQPLQNNDYVTATGGMPKTEEHQRLPKNKEEHHNTTGNYQKHPEMLRSNTGTGTYRKADCRNTGTKHTGTKMELVQ